MLLNEWTQREIRKNIWNLVKLKKKPGSKGYRDVEDQIIMLNDILFDLQDINEDEADALYEGHPVKGLMKPEIPFERLGEPAIYPHEAPQWIPARSREDIRNRIKHYRSHPTMMRPYFGNANYYNLQHMTYPPRLKKKMTYRDYFNQLHKIAMEDIAPEVASFAESANVLKQTLGASLRNFPYQFPYIGEYMWHEKLPGPAPLASNIPRQMAAEGDNEMHWLLPWSIWRTMRIMPLLAKLMTRGPELQYETYHPTPTEAKALVQSATLRIPRYRLGENIPWNKKIYHMYNNRNGRYVLDELRRMTAKWITRNVPPTKAVAHEKSFWSRYQAELSGIDGHSLNM